MKYFFIVLLIFFSISSVNCQVSTFKLLHITPNDESIIDVKEDELGNFYCVGFSRKPESYNLDGIVLKLDSYGHIIDSSRYSIGDKSILIYQITQDTLGTFIFTAGISDTTPDLLNSELLLKRVNYSLEDTDSKKYFISEDRSFGLMYTSIGFNHDLLISSGLWSRVSNPPVKKFNIRLNNKFDSLHSKIETSAGSGLSLKQLTDSTYWNLVEGFVYNITDTLFNTIHSSISAKTLMSPVGNVWDSDTSFYICGQWNNSNNDKDIGIIKQFHPTDTANNIFNSWGNKDTVDLPAGRGGALDFNNNDSIYIGGTTNFQGGWPHNPSYFFLIQTDSMLNVRWERFYGGDIFYEMNDVLATNDGGCLMSGISYDYSYGVNKHDIYIVKVNKEGLITGLVEENNIKSYEAIVYPNPGVSEINIRIAAQYKESKFELFDFNGHMVISEKLIGNNCLIETDKLNAGSYIYSITNNKGLNETGIWIKQ